MLIKCTFPDGDYLEFDEALLPKVKAYMQEAINIIVKEELEQSIIETNKEVVDSAVETVLLKDPDGNIKNEVAILIDEPVLFEKPSNK